MSRELRLTVETLADWLVGPSGSPRAGSRSLGDLQVVIPDHPAEPIAGRWLTRLAYAGRFVLLVDEFRAEEIAHFGLAVESKQPLEGGRRRCVVHDPAGPLAIHPLGDYATRQEAHVLELTQQVRHGRFLLAVTSDPEANVRVLNGWSVELRSQGRVFHLLHSNGSRRLRPLGPVQTDAWFGLADWPALPAGAAVAPFTAQLHLLDATQVQWGPNHHLALASPTHLRFDVQERPIDSAETGTSATT